MKGYWKQKKSTENVLINSSDCGYKGYITGDIVMQDDSGKYYFLGRSNDTIKSGGYRIELGEIEAVISKMEVVQNVAAVPIPDKILENKIVAFIILKSNNSILYQDIVDECKNALPQYMLPYRIFFKNRFPVNSSGKIDKKRLIKEFENIEKYENNLA
jgi:acyl-coenzyme A synthetase/AMP-(fatty) acid ligase